MKASDAIARVLAEQGVRYCFELVGGMITHMLDSIASDGRIRIVSMHHEQSAAFAAEGVVRATCGGETAVAMGTSGPGATNLLTGIGSCWFDSVPAVFITGQVNTSELKGDRAIRQQGFQELDIVAMARPITKHAVRVDDPARLVAEIRQAFAIARAGRPGPVLIDIPNDVQRAEIPDSAMSVPVAIPAARPGPTLQALTGLRELCAAARRPLVCLGGGARWSDRLDRWIRALEGCGIPYVSTLMGHERVICRPHYFHMIGAYGNREANWALQNCDLLLVIGARLDVRQTGANVADFARAATIVQVDIDPGQINNRVTRCIGIESDAGEFMRAFEPKSAMFPGLDPAWVGDLVDRRRAAYFDEYPEWEISPTLLLRAINDAVVGQEVQFVCDVGNHQMWAAHGLRLGAGQAVHYSGGMGAMGFALPAAIGVALVGAGRTLVLTGDGSLQVNIQDLDTVAHLGLDMVIVVMNNQSLGMVKNFQDLYFGGRDQSTRKGYSSPSFKDVANAYGIPSTRAQTAEQVKSELAALRARKGPFLLEIMMPYAGECRPRLAFGSRLDEQWPPLGGPVDVA